MKKILFFEAVLMTTVLGLCLAASAQTFNIVVQFDGTNGEGPWAPPVQGTDGNLYGITSGGGTSGGGTVYQVSTTGEVSTIHTFCSHDTSCTDGSLAEALVLGTNGNLYGVTAQGGSYTVGTIFEVSPTGTFTILHSFCALRNCADGEGPSTLVQGDDGDFYGIAGGGGQYGQGTFFRMTPDGKLTTISSFKSGNTYLNNGLIQATDGNFYGTTIPNTTGYGTLIRLTATGKLTTIHTFCAQAPLCPDGSYPYGTLLQATDGNLYGTTAFGGANNRGTVFKLSASGKFTTLYSFCPVAKCADGANPTSGLLQGSDGNFYGSTTAGGTGTNAHCLGDGCGVDFQLTPAGALTVLHNLCTAGGKSCLDGFNQQVFSSPSLMQSTDGRIFGATIDGGLNSCYPYEGCGALYDLSLGLPPMVNALPNFGKAGQTVEILGNDLTGASAVSFNGVLASDFTVVSPTEIQVIVPSGATTGTIQVTTPMGTISTNVLFKVLP